MSVQFVSFVVVGFGLIWVLTIPEPRLRRVASGATPVRSLWLVGVVAVEAAAFLLGSPTLAVAAPIAAVIIHKATARVRRRAQRHRLKSALPAFTDELTQQLRSGGSLAGSFVRVAEESPHLTPIVSPVMKALDAGERFETALTRIETNDEAVRLVLVTIRLLVATGGPTSETIERMGENVRAVIAAEEEAKALAGQGTASALVLGVLPVLFGMIAAFSSSDLANFYAFEWLGAACVCASLLLTGASWFWMDGLLWGKN